MIEETGRVVAVDTSPDGQTEAWVETIRKGTCNGCAAEPGCGQSLLAKWADSKRSHIKVVTNQLVQVDDQVVLGINENTLLKGSLAAYGLPMVAMLFMTLLAHSGLGLAEPLVILAALVGLVVGFGLVRLYGSMTREQLYRPELLRVLRAESTVSAWQPSEL